MSAHIFGKTSPRGAVPTAIPRQYTKADYRNAERDLTILMADPTAPVKGILVLLMSCLQSYNALRHALALELTAWEVANPDLVAATVAKVAAGSTQKPMPMAELAKLAHGPLTDALNKFAEWEGKGTDELPGVSGSDDSGPNGVGEGVRTREGDAHEGGGLASGGGRGEDSGAASPGGSDPLSGDSDRGRDPGQ